MFCGLLNCCDGLFVVSWLLFFSSCFFSLLMLDFRLVLYDFIIFGIVILFVIVR